jgi:large subunit ribosomal protein L22
MHIIAESKFIRMSPKKIRETAHVVVGLSPRVALDRLSFAGTHASRVLKKVIESAVSNATNNAKLSANTLMIERIEIGKGPFFKRWNPVSRGMAHAIKKKTSHIKVVLTEKSTGKALPGAVIPSKEASVEAVKPGEAKKAVIEDKKSLMKEKKK